VPFDKNAGVKPARNCSHGLLTQGNPLGRIALVRFGDEDKALYLFARTAHFLPLLIN
jgi:hypothetical protein